MTKETADFKDEFLAANIEAGKTVIEAYDAWDYYLATIATKQVILGVASDLVADFMYYDRKEDENLPRDAIENAVAAGVVTYDEIADVFRAELKKNDN